MNILIQTYGGWLNIPNDNKVKIMKTKLKLLETSVKLDVELKKNSDISPYRKL